MRKKKIEIPDFYDYYPDIKQENRKIKHAYKYLSEQWDHGNFVELYPIDKKTSYLFYYLHIALSLFSRQPEPS